MVKRAAISKESKDWQKLYQKLLKMEKMLSTEDSSIRCLSNKDCLKYAQVSRYSRSWKFAIGSQFTANCTQIHSISNYQKCSEYEARLTLCFIGGGNRLREGKIEQNEHTWYMKKIIRQILLWKQCLHWKDKHLWEKGLKLQGKWSLHQRSLRNVRSASIQYLSYHIICQTKCYKRSENIC